MAQFAFDYSHASHPTGAFRYIVWCTGIKLPLQVEQTFSVGTYGTRERAEEVAEERRERGFHARIEVRER